MVAAACGRFLPRIRRGVDWCLDDRLRVPDHRDDLRLLEMRHIGRLGRLFSGGGLLLDCLRFDRFDRFVRFVRFVRLGRFDGAATPSRRRLGWLGVVVDLADRR
jgi:hypothetical protein